MKHISLLLSLVILCALALIPSTQAAVGLSVSPANITNDYVGKVTLTMTGLSAGQTVLVERFTDVNGNGVVDAATDRVARSFTVTDGQLPIIGGVRNLNVPGDDDGVANGQIRVDLDSPGIDIIFGTASGSFIYRVSDPVNGFTPVTQTFTVAQKNYSQGIRGGITAAGGAPLAGAFVALLDANGHGIRGAFTDANGNYALMTLPGSYLIIPLHPGYIADGRFAGATVVANQFTTNNQALATGAFTLSGRLTDASSGAGIAGVSMLGQSTNNLFSLSTLSDTSGNYSFAVGPSQWRLEPPGDGLAQLGYLRPDKLTTNITTASAANVNFALPKVTALIYGTVKDNLNNPVNGVDTRADDQTNNRYEGEGGSIAPNANYTLGVVAGSWWATVQSDSLPPGYTSGTGTNVTISAGQAVQVNLILSSTTAHLLGKVVNSSGTAQSGLEIQANPQNGGNGPQVVTAGDGSFDLGVSAGTWTIQLHNDNGAPSNLIGPNLTFNVTDGVNVNNINYVVQSVTAQITGIITNTLGSPLGDLGVYAYATINGANYNQYVDTDAGGHFSIGIVNGTWSVGVDCNGLDSRGYGCVNNQTVVVNGGNQTANFVASPLNSLQITTGTTLPGATVNTAYNTQLQASGGTPAYAWLLLSGSLPNGLFLNSGNGVISGTPSVNGTFNFTIKVTDAANQTATLAFSLVVNTSSGADVIFYSVSKQASFVQTDASAPSLETNSPFRFSASVNPSTPTSVTTASVQSPGGSTQALGYSTSDQQFGIKANYSSQSALDAAYPAGNYTLSFNAVHDGNKTLTLSLPATSFPNAPHINNLSAAQAIDPSAGFFLTWDALSGGTSGDFISVSIDNQNGQTVFSTADIWQPGGLDGTATGIQIPANTLAVGQTYSAKVQFVKVTTRDTATYPGAFGAVGLLAKTKVNIATIGTSDTTPPSLLSSSPANGGSDVAVNSSVLFTFSEPMQSGVSITWSVANTFFYTWSADQRMLICNNNTLPAGTTINWVLNPSAAGQNFRDLAGNALPSNVSGSFTTAGSTGTWTYKPFMPTARVAPRAAIINGLLYVVGGFDNSGNLLSALEVYDPNQGTWQSLAPMPTARHSPAVGVINGKLYVAGGAYGGTVLEVYDPVSNTWSNKRPMNINQQGAAGVIGNKLYVVGPSSDFTKSLEVYDPITDTWTVKTPMPNPRSAGAAVLNGELYTVGGDGFGTVEAYDPATDSWSSKASLPGTGNTIYNPGVAVLNGNLYVVGGFNNGTTVEVYDPTSNQWSYGPSMLSARGDLAVAALSDRLFAVGGVDAPGQTPLPFLEQLSLGTNDSVVTLVLRSDSATLAAGLGSGVPSSALLNRLNAGDTSGLTFQSALVGAFGSSIYPPTGSPIDTQLVNIPPGNGQNGFFQLSFVLPSGYSGAQISCGATMDYYGRAFLNGNPLTPAIDSSQPSPAPGTIAGNNDTFFSTKSAAFFHAGTNYFVLADINANGGASAGAFFCLATYRVPPSSLSDPAKLSGNQFQFTLTGDSGAVYRIEATTNFSAWTVLGTNTATGGSFLFVDPAAASGFKSRFYRAVLVP